MGDKRDPVCHRMGRRNWQHDYRRPGIYHVTLRAAVGQPFGSLEGAPEAPRLSLSAVGRMVEAELLRSLPGHYPMVKVDTYVVMPDHVHVLLRVTAPLVSLTGRAAHLGLVISGFKYGCTVKYRALLAGAAGTRPPEAAGAVAGALLFDKGYCDVMPVDREQLLTQRAYILDNPRSRLQRMACPERLTARRGAVTTDMGVAGLMGYLRRECPSWQATPEALTAVAERLLTRADFRPPEAAGAVGAGIRSPEATGAVGGRMEIVCDSYGERGLLRGRLLPVVCHRRDAGRREKQRRRCLEEAAAGAVLVSARVANDEQAIVDEALERGYAVVLVADNGFPERYHPSAVRQQQCAEGRLLLLSPWSYRHRGRSEALTVPFCKAMNAVAQAVCRVGDGWWKG